jgi:hypothetical protein
MKDGLSLLLFAVICSVGVAPGRAWSGSKHAVPGARDKTPSSDESKVEKQLVGNEQLIQGRPLDTAPGGQSSATKVLVSGRFYGGDG